MPAENKDSLEDRVRKLLDKPTASDNELAQRFNTVFATQPISTQNYAIPKDAYYTDMDKEVNTTYVYGFIPINLEDLFDENNDDDIYGNILSTSKDSPMYGLNNHLDAITQAWIGSQDDTDETHELIQRIHQENALDQKYSQFNQHRDEQLEKRYLELKKDAPSTSAPSNKPKGKIPTSLSKQDFEDETDNWCCICNEDAAVECLGCEDDNRYCKGCFHYTHRSESADYEATKHKMISQVLRQSLHNGIKAALIMTSEGSLISFAADNDKNATIYSAISANIWNTYRKKDTELYTNLQYQIIHCQEGVVFVTGLGSMILCLVGDSKVDLGILKAKAEALKGHLEGPLQQVAPYNDN
ncbi:Ragulator complex protein LAMTOR2 [Choanephora cucurbitarum]|uniref:Ragulator complex protein LAMTOR2 n=1 Tax=Choanephora cucurbitarum TaxID=101091 RepID=A0A1C7N6T6_9FUNG|nr:Ragulator complex protein LAMTOR2 [Choanephora cucurbitarum]